MAEVKKIEKSVGLLQYAIGAIVPGVLMGFASGACCCVFQIPVGFLSGVLVRVQKGSPLSLVEGAAAGFAGGLVSGLLHPVFAVTTSALIRGFFGGGLNALDVANIGLSGAVGLAVGVVMGIFFGVTGGLLVALEGELTKK